jgi:hypothetical protein
MSYFRCCPFCGANLDPGEVCDCKEKAAPGEQDREAAEEISTLQLYHKKGELSNE